MTQYSNPEPQPYSNRTSVKQSTFFTPATRNTTGIYDFAGSVVATPIAEIDSKTISSFDIKIVTPIDLADKYYFEIYSYTYESTVTIEKDNTNTAGSGYSIYTLDGFNDNTKYRIRITAERTTSVGIKQSEYIELNEYTDYMNIVINSLIETQSGSCSFNTSETCLATSTYVIYETGSTSYLWEVTGATIASGQGTVSITVTTDSETDDTFNVKCTCSNNYEIKSINNDYIHDRTEIVNTPLTIDSITETVAGSCEHYTNYTCATSSTYVASVSGSPISYSWIVTGATLESGQSTDTIVVTSDSDNDTIFTVELNVTNSISDETLSNQYTHVRIENTDIVDMHQTYDISNIATEFI